MVSYLLGKRKGSNMKSLGREETFMALCFDSASFDMERESGERGRSS